MSEFKGIPVTTSAAPPLVNLPDFSRLVEQTGPAVVNIRTIRPGAITRRLDCPGGTKASERPLRRSVRRNKQMNRLHEVLPS